MIGTLSRGGKGGCAPRVPPCPLQRSHTPRQYETDDLVLARQPGRMGQAKIGQRFDGPFKVSERKNDIYVLKRPDNGRTYERHVASLKPYHAASSDNTDRQEATANNHTEDKRPTNANHNNDDDN